MIIAITNTSARMGIFYSVILHQPCFYHFIAIDIILPVLLLFHGHLRPVGFSICANNGDQKNIPYSFDHFIVIDMILSVLLLFSMVTGDWSGFQSAPKTDSRSTFVSTFSYVIHDKARYL